jgi:hypothetical protein
VSPMIFLLKLLNKLIDFFNQLFFLLNILCKVELLMVTFFICYCIFGVYLVTGTKNPDISQEETFRISKLIFYITTRGTLKDGQTRFLRVCH